MKKPITFDVVREVGLTLPRARESRYYGMPALKVDDEMFACCTSHRSAEPNSISVPVGFERREELVAAHPDIFYVKPHYTAYPVVLVRLDRISRSVLQRLLRSAHRAVATGAVIPGKRTPRSSPTRRRGRAFKSSPNLS
jgi:hypothetical protein